MWDNVDPAALDLRPIAQDISRGFARNDVQSGEWESFPGAVGVPADHMQAVAFENEIWWLGGTEVTCPWHGWSFDVQLCDEDPKDGLCRYKVHAEDGELKVEIPD